MTQPDHSLLSAYLKNWAEPESRLVGWPARSRFSYGFVLPLYDESTEWLSALPRVGAKDAPVLIVAVVNAPLSAPEDAVSRTRNLLEQLLELGDQQQLSPGCDLIRLRQDVQLVVVDRVSQGLQIADNQGVGLARKIGGDILVSARLGGHLLANHIINVDADVLDLQVYLNVPASHDAAVVLPFTHSEPDQPDQRDLLTAHRLYELRLWHYVLGLAAAGSPYAFHTIGSVLIVQLEAYAKVRGVPKRSAGEDFHLLNKLRKVGGVLSPPAPRVQIRARHSSRTPYGTGPAVRKLTSDIDPSERADFYDPRVFSALREVLQLFNQPAMFDAMPKFQGLLSHSEAGKAVDSTLHAWGAERVRAALSQQSSDHEAFLRHWHTWFDGLKTLRLVHALEHPFPKVSLSGVIAAGTTVSDPDTLDAMVGMAEAQWNDSGYAGLTVGPLGQRRPTGSTV